MQHIGVHEAGSEEIQRLSPLRDLVDTGVFPGKPRKTQPGYQQSLFLWENDIEIVINRLVNGEIHGPLPKMLRLVLLV